MNFIRQFIKNASSRTATNAPTKLGRWHLHYDPKIVNSKVDQANEDHCGCCYVPTQEKQTKQQMQAIQKRKWQERQQQRNYAQTQTQAQKCSETDEYYLPYFM
jgi:hypothetical protein